ncbi:MAG: LacI family DNA-binding transcriptional regulator [Candidatus Omnitrophota bacterium]
MVTKKARIEDVARLAGVSTTTVSRVINKIPTVNKTSRLKVESAIHKLKYRPNISAQRLAGGKKGALGLVIPRFEGIFYSFYAIEIIRGIGTACDAQKLDLVLHLTDGSTSINLASIDGVIFADILGETEQLKEVISAGIPSVVINNTAQDFEITSVSINNKKGAKEATEHLISLGHKRIAHITGDLKTQAAEERLLGFKEVLSNKGFNLPREYIKHSDYSRHSARTLTLELLKLKSPPTAIFAASDDMALEVEGVIIENSLKVPSDISVVGFDDNPAGCFGPVALTTVKQPLIEMCQIAVKELLNQINSKVKEDNKKLMLPTKLVVRDSTSSPKSN